MAFVRIPRSRVVHKGKPTVRVTTDSLELNVSAAACFDPSVKYVDVLFDETTYQIAVMPAEKVADAHTLCRSKTVAKIYARVFLQERQFSVPQYCDAEWTDGRLVFTIDARKSLSEGIERSRAEAVSSLRKVQ